MFSADPKPQDLRENEAAARASFLLMPPRKWQLVRAFEALVRFLLPLVPSPRVIGSSSAQPSSILVVEYWNLGDLAILVPFLRNLRRSFPEARISLLVNAGVASFLQGQGIVDEFIPVRVPWAQHFNRWKKYNPFSRHWISLARTILGVRRRQFDWAFSGRMDVRDNFLLWLSGASRRIGYGFGGGGFLLTDRIAPDLSRPHRADIWLHLIEAVHESPNRELRGFQLTDTELASARSFLASRGISLNAYLIGIHPGARIPIRRWGDDRFAEVAQNLLVERNAHILWFSEPGSDSEAPLFERCHQASLDFHSFLGLLSLCRLLICNDSGPMQLANLLSVPVVAVFGPTNPNWFGPRGPQDRIVIRPEFLCRPCFDYCIYDQPYCMRTISVEEVSRAVNATLEFKASRMPERAGTSTKIEPKL